MECKYLDHQWTSVNDTAARMALASAAPANTKAAFDSGPQETIAVDPERIKPAEVILPPELPDEAAATQPPPPQFSAWASSQGYVFEW